MELISHKLALYVVAIAAALDMVAGVLFSAVEHVSVGSSLYWAVTTATTVGYGDIAPKTPVGKWIAVLVMLSVVPLFAATFSLFTSVLTSKRLARGEHRLHQKLDHIIKHHPAVPELEEDAA